MTTRTTIDKDKTAVLIMDFISFIIDQYASDPTVVDRAARVLGGARNAGIPIIHVVPGPIGQTTSMVDQIHPTVAPAPEDRFIVKNRIGSFSTTGLEALLHDLGRDTLVLMGVATSGCVLSTFRWALDLNYKLVVVEDGCSDPDPAVHEALTGNPHPKSFLTFARHGTVTTSGEFLKALA